MRPLFGGIEAGGTKFVCAVGSGPGDLRDIRRIETTTPAETLGRVINNFRQYDTLKAVGIGAFGPLDLNTASRTFGSITATPKPGWSKTDVLGTLSRALHLPVGIDTDVNAAVLGESRWGAGHGLHTFVYLTIGTGIGGGALVNGTLLHGLVHTEMGHMLIPHDPQEDPYPGRCPFHNDCLEGLAAGPSMQERWGTPPRELPADHPAWGVEAHYIALALVNTVCMLSPQRIILGGGVMEQHHLFPRIRQSVQTLLHGYVRAAELEERMDSYIVPPALGNRSGILGAIALAEAALGHSPL